MARLLVIFLVAALVTAGACVLLADVLFGAPGGVPSNASIYQYGNR